MGCDHPNRSIGRRVVVLQHFPIWRPSAILNLNFDNSTTHEISYAIPLAFQNLVSILSSPSEILQFYDFASLAGKCLTTPVLGVFGRLER